MLHTARSVSEAGTRTHAAAAGARASAVQTQRVLRNGVVVDIAA